MLSGPMVFGPFGGEEEKPKLSEPLWEATHALLTELGADYNGGLAELPSVRYKRGDIVTLRPGFADDSFGGRPAVVLEVAVPEVENLLPPEGHGCRIDIRLAVWRTDQQIGIMWTESWMLITYVPKTEPALE